MPFAEDGQLNILKIVNSSRSKNRVFSVKVAKNINSLKNISIFAVGGLVLCRCEVGVQEIVGSANLKGGVVHECFLRKRSGGEGKG